MVNTCDVKKKIYDKSDYWDVQAIIELADGDINQVYEELDSMYDSFIVSAIQDAIENNTFGENWIMEPVNETSVPTQFNFPGMESEQEDGLLSYYLDQENLLEARDRMASRFFEDVISRTLYNKTEGSYLNPTTESVNKALYEYKLELLRNLWEYTGISHSIEVAAGELTLAISRTISDYLSKAKSYSTNKYWDDYVILRNFNKLLEDYTPFIKIDAAFKGTDYQSESMYIWDPAGSYRESWTTSEDGDIAKMTSPLVKMLADYFTTEQGVPIGFKTYNTVMSTVAIWIHEHSYDAEVDAISRDLRHNGLSANFNKMIDVYINRAKPTESMKQVLRAIQKHIFNKYNVLPINIQHAFANQFFITAKYAYMAYRQSYNGNQKHIKGQYLEDSFVDVRLTSLMKKIRDNVWMYHQSPALFKKFKEDHGIIVSFKDGIYTIHFDSRYGDFDITIGNDNTDTIVIHTSKVQKEKVNNNAFINLIQDVLDEIIPDDYRDILTSMDTAGNNRATLFGTFINPIAIILAASEDTEHEHGLFKYDYNGDLKTYNFKSNFAQAAVFESIKDGIQELNVLKNGEGNNLPIYQLAPAVFDIFTVIDEIIDCGKNEKSQAAIELESIVSKDPKSLYDVAVKSVLAKNLFTSGTAKGLLRKIVVRSDIKIGDKVKSSDKLSAGEVASLAIFNDFYQMLTSVVGKGENSELQNCILLQPITYSDKKSHFLPLIDLSKLLLNVTSISGITSRVSSDKIFRNIVNPNLSKAQRETNIKAIRDKIVEVRSDKAKRQIYNQYLRFYATFIADENYGLNDKLFVLKDGTRITSEEAKELITSGTKPIPKIVANKLNGFNTNDGFQYVAKILSNLNQFQNPTAILRAMFKTQGALLNEDFDFITLKSGNVQANESLYFTYKTFDPRNDYHLNRYIQRQQFLFALDLIENGVWMDVFEHPELKVYCESFGKEGDYLAKDWYDEESRIMKLARFFRDGKEIFPTQSDIESDAFRHDSTVTVELNPMIEGYFYANALFGEQINQVELGGTEGYIPKVMKALDFSETDDSSIAQTLDSISEMYASRLANEFKRSTYEGAIKRRFTLGRRFGVSSKIRTAIVEDMRPDITNLRGETMDQVAQDGAGFTSPLLHFMQNESLVDSPVGWVKKTIAGWVDPRTGTQNHFKWAETAITMFMRQSSEYAEQMYKKMHSTVSVKDKFRGISDLKMYYNPGGSSVEIQEHSITETDYIYSYDVDHGKYYKLMAVRKNGDAIQAIWYAVDENGDEVLSNGKPIVLRESTEINTLYDIDKAFGGRFTFELVDGQFKPSEKVHKLLYNIVCANDMKEDFVGYVVNHSAAKAGAVNVNDSDIFNNDDQPLNTFYIASFGIGVQMDADHEMDFASVTEMSQMISLLTQGGYNIELVNQAYEDIGRVSAEAMRDILASVDTHDPKIYRIIGKALLDTFDSGTKEELGLAQAFIRNAQNAILKETGKDNIILPYSAESIRGSFVAAVTSLINKRGIRRKYAGFGAVQVPAEGIMQHYTIDGVDHNYLGMRDAIRPILKQNGITWEQASTQILIDGKLNPFIKPINEKTIQWEDTIVVYDKLTGTFSKPIKITTGQQFDKYRNLLDDSQQVYRWEIKPKELTQNDLRIKVHEESSQFGSLDLEISEFDVDSVRASFYIDELIAYKKNPEKNREWLNNTERKLNVIRAVLDDSDLSLRRGTNIAKIGNIETFSISFLKNLKKQCITKSQEYFNKLSQIQKSGQMGELPVQMASVGDDPLARLLVRQTLVEVRPITAKVVLGRRNFRQYLLKKGDRLSDIKKEGWNFFYRRLVQRTGIIGKVRGQIDKSIKYDGILNLGNGDNVLVIVGDQRENLHNFGEKTNDFVVSDKAISYKGQVLFDDAKLGGLCTVKDLSFYSCIGTDGKLLNVIHVPSYEVFDRIKSSSSVIDSQYNYNDGNWLDILRYHYADHFNEDGSFKSQIKIDDYVITEDYIDNPDNIWDTLNRRESKIENNARLEHKAKLMYRNFMQQLQYIQTRIPAQAMQSTMNIEVIDFADTDTNYIWVPKMLMCLQGSDLDIDKAYCMGYDIDDSGNIYALSDLIKSLDYSVDDVLLLPAPTFGQVRVNMSQTAIDEINPVTIDFTDKMATLLSTKKIDIVKSILSLFKDNPGKTINLVIDWNRLGVLKADWFNQIIKDVNTHEASTRSDREKESALRNQVLTAARRIMNDPASQLNAYTPIAMNEPRAAAKLNTSLGSKEKEMTLDNGMTFAIMQKQNMSGKEVIAMTATGIKSYFIITTYFNTLANEVEQLLAEYETNPSQELANRIVTNLHEITFDGKLDSSASPILRTFANVNFFNIKNLIERLERAGIDTESILYSEEPAKTKANTAFEQYAYNGVLNLKQLINDLDYRANGNTWIIKSNRAKDTAFKISQLIDDNFTEAELIALFDDPEAMDDFLLANEEHSQEISDILSDFYDYFVINAPDSLSALLSAATDNAKELILDKLNATSKFADIYTTLLAQGVPFITIAEMMTNRAFGIVAKYSQDSIFEPKSSFFRVENALKFVLNEGSLSTIRTGLFEKFLMDDEDSPVDPKSISSHKHRGFYNLIKGLKLNTGETIQDIISEKFIDLNKKDIEKILSYVRYCFPIYNGVSDEEISPNNILAAILSNRLDIPKSLSIKDVYKWRDSVSSIILGLFNDTTRTITLRNGELVTVADGLKFYLLENLKDSINRYPKKERTRREQIDLDSMPDEFDVDMESVEPEDIEFEEVYSSSRNRSNVLFKGPIKRNELIEIYRYVLKYFIPKNELWNSLSEDVRKKAIKDFSKLSTEVLYSAKEMRMLGSIGSINGGLRPKDFDEYKYVKNLNKFINAAYISRGEGIDEEFDLIRFITETEPTEEDVKKGRKSYHDRHLDYYDSVKSSVNILKAIDYTGNFREMFKYVATNRQIIENSAAIKLERRIEDQLLRSVHKRINSDPTTDEGGISKASTIILSDKEFRTLSQYVRDLIVLNFFMGRHDLKMIVPKGQQFYDSEGSTTKEPVLSPGVTIDTPITLDNVKDLATFKHLMDWYIIPRLKTDPRFKDNKFLKNLIRDRIVDEKSGESIISYKVNVPLVNIGDSPKAKRIYSEILSDFNKLLYYPIDQGVTGELYGIGDWTIGNLFYMYNLLVNKDRIGGNAMTRLFEDLITSGNNSSLASEYYKYVSDLDQGKLDIFNEDGTINEKVFAFDIKDLKYRLSGYENAKYRFGVGQTQSDVNPRIVRSVEIYDSSDSETASDYREVSDDRTYISDFILGLPFSTQLRPFIKEPTDIREDFNEKLSVDVSSQTVFEALANEMADSYGKAIPMEMLTEEEIRQEFADRDDVDILAKSSGFIVNGNIYLNLSSAYRSLDAPMHEIMHFIAAAMKFSDDPNIRNMYYNLLDWVTNKFMISTRKEDVELREQILDKGGFYGNRHMSDVKEEILVTLLAREFKERFGNIWGSSKELSKDRIQAAVKMTIAKMLNSDDILDVDFNTLGNTRLISVLKKFTSQILVADTNLATMLEHNQELAELKDFLIKNGFITLEGDCL